jgi:hypothetical protein
MALFLTTAAGGVPKFADKPGAHWRLSPDGARAIIEFLGGPADYAEAKADPDTRELTRREARAQGKLWDDQMGAEA